MSEYAKRADYYREYARRYRQSDKGRAAVARAERKPERIAAKRAYRKTEAQMGYGRAFARTPESRARRRDYAREYRKRPDVWARELARKAVARAVKRGEIVRPESCGRCGIAPAREHDGRSGMQFHHTHGYARAHRLTGEWLCRNCHVHADAAEVGR